MAVRVAIQDRVRTRMRVRMGKKSLGLALRKWWRPKAAIKESDRSVMTNHLDGWEEPIKGNWELVWSRERGFLVAATREMRAVMRKKK